MGMKNRLLKCIYDKNEVMRYILLLLLHNPFDAYSIKKILAYLSESIPELEDELDGDDDDNHKNIEYILEELYNVKSIRKDNKCNYHLTKLGEEVALVLIEKLTHEQKQFIEMGIQIWTI